MRTSNLPSPGIGSQAIGLRRLAAQAISQVEVTAGKTPGGKITSAKTLSDFFTSCATALSALYDIVAPTVSTRIRTSSTVATITFSEALDQSSVPGLSSITIGARVLSAVTVNSSGQLVVTGVGITAGDTFTYTKPATSALRDPAGNEVGTFTGALA